MSSTGLGVGLGIGLPLLAVVVHLLCYTYSAELSSRPESDLEMGSVRSTARGPRRPSTTAGAGRLSQSAQGRQTAASRVRNDRGQSRNRATRLHSSNSNAAQPGQPRQRPQTSTQQAQPRRSLSSRRSVRIRSHPLVGLSGDELRSLGRGRRSSVALPINTLEHEDRPHNTTQRQELDGEDVPVPTTIPSASEPAMGNATAKRPRSMSTPSATTIPPVQQTSTEKPSLSRAETATLGQSTTQEARTKALRLRSSITHIPYDLEDIDSDTGQPGLIPNPPNNDDSSSSSTPPSSADSSSTRHNNTTLPQPPLPNPRMQTSSVNNRNQATTVLPAPPPPTGPTTPLSSPSTEPQSQDRNPQPDPAPPPLASPPRRRRPSAQPSNLQHTNTTTPTANNNNNQNPTPTSTNQHPPPPSIPLSQLPAPGPFAAELEDNVAVYPGMSVELAANGESIRRGL
ncbi:MAG: hypothetical protein L6R40_006956 [Gallowayella cf. fulva]|nr:MAG: hypothetical protein L6R40_006956 [Xanthomendoza cf. fulva]